MKKTMMVVAASWSVACLPSAAPADEPGPAAPSLAAALSGSSDGAGAARDQLIMDAVQKLKDAEADGRSGASHRPWHDMTWDTARPGRVGRLYDLCTGAVEPPPKLSIGSWTWGTLDPRKLPPEDRRRVVEWQMQQVIAQYGCGTIFAIGTLSHDAHKQLNACPPHPGQDGGSRDVNAFVAYVHGRPAKRRSDDPTAVLVEALRALGCS
jgi:hypothetical protein